MYPKGFVWEEAVCAFEEAHDPPRLLAVGEVWPYRWQESDIVVCGDCADAVERGDGWAVKAVALRVFPANGIKAFGSTGTWKDAYEAVLSIKDSIALPTERRALWSDGMSKPTGDPYALERMMRPFVPDELNPPSLYWLEPATQALIEESSADVPRPTFVSDLDIPDSGFVLFGKPLWLPQRAGNSALEVATGMSWTVGQIEGNAENVLFVLPWLTPTMTGPIITEDSVHDADDIRLMQSSLEREWIKRQTKVTGPIMPFVPSVLLNADHELITEIPEAGDWLSPENYMFRLFVAFAAWVQSTVTPEDKPADRAIRRQYQRKKQEPPLVKMVKLRGAESLAVPDEASEPTEHDDSERSRFDHRWVVSGHWREQACGPNHSRRRPVFIAPHIKGPEGTEVRHTERIYKVDR